ncbi:hypothetical protein [Halosimplex halophilum]|uniref:hypothetical protein n=1 Tax=Halosimplex halophilum TaxID=2559572 RepID=UPI00107F6C01|nr:hypothetical protein [Halosimplex halophilum]
MDTPTTGGPGRERGQRDEPGRRATTRRSLLGALAISGTAGLAGCLGFGGDGGDDGPDGGGFRTVGREGGPEPTATPAPDGTTEPGPTAPGPDRPTETPTTPAGTDSSGGEWPSVEDPYYSALQDDLAAMDVPPGEFVYADDEADALDAFQIWTDIAETSSLSVGDDRSFSAARRVEVTEEPDNPWDVTMNGPVNNRSVSEGDVLLGVVHLRVPVSSPTDSTVQFVAKDEDNPETNMVTTRQRVTPPTEWTRYYVPMQWSYDSEAGTWWWELFHGFGVQTTDVGGIALVDFDRAAEIEDLPSGPAGVDE